jgi:hypothetical protein
MQMTCSNPECGGAILVGDRFCGLCGTSAPEALRLAPWPGPTGAAPGSPGEEPLFSHERPWSPGTLSNATRFLCAAAYLNHTFANRVIRDLLATRRAVAPSINFDVGPVLRHCLRARRTILFRDIALLGIILVGLVIRTLTTLDFLLFVVSIGVLLPRVRRRRGGLVGTMLFAVGAAAGLAIAVALLASLAFGSFASSLAVTGSLSSGAASFLGFVFTFALLVAATWATEFVYLHTTFRTLIEDLRGGSAAPRAVSGAAEARIAIVEGAQRGNVTLHAGRFPFIGAGGQTDVHWSIAIRLRPSKDPHRQRLEGLSLDDGPAPTDKRVQIDPVDLHHWINEKLAGLNDPGLPDHERIGGLTISDRVVGSGLLGAGNPLLDADLKTPYSHASREAVEALIRHPQARLRYYQQVSVSDEGPAVMSRGRKVIDSVDQEVAVSAFVYVAVEGGMLYLQFVLTALPPIDQRYRVVGFRYGTSFAGTLGYSVKRVFGSIASAPSGIYAAFQLWRDERRAEREYLSSTGGDFGTQVSVREMATAPWFGTYIEELDVEKYNKMFSRLLLDEVQEYLRAHGVDTSAFLNSAQNIIDNSNNSYIKGDHNKVEQVNSQSNNNDQ